MSSKSRSSFWVKASHGLNRPRLPAPLGTERHGDGAGSDGHCSIGHVKRLFAALAGIAGIAWLRSRNAPPVDEAPDPPVDVDTRRRDVHDRARAAMDELSSDD